MSSRDQRCDRGAEARIEAALSRLHEGLPAPPYSLALVRPAARRAPRAVLALALAATAAVAFATGWWFGRGTPHALPTDGMTAEVGAELPHEPRRLVVPPEVAELASWRPTTDVLLAGARDLASPPPLELLPPAPSLMRGER